ncbi:MAG: hypothetical protein JWP01_1891 [Myxococcales bacterium]|nr:hypothetical protein [Myxococcales bacterium]
MTSLLIHSVDLSADVRDALRAASDSQPDMRAELLQQAARMLYRETELECGDVRELVGLPTGSCG